MYWKHGKNNFLTQLKSDKYWNPSDQKTLRGQCQADNIIYQATVTPTPDPPLGDPPDPRQAETQTYVGLCSTKFKTRYAYHTKSFKWEKYSTETVLSQHIWDLKRNKIEYTISWKILDRGQQFSPVSGMCSLCTNEKYCIIFKPETASLNKRDEIFGHCLHKKPNLLDKT